MAAGSLVIQGTTLGPVIKMLNLPDNSDETRDEQRTLRRQMAAISDEVLNDPSVCGTDGLLARSIEQLRVLEADADFDGDALDLRLHSAAEMRRVRRVIIARQRVELLNLRDRGAYSSEALSDALRLAELWLDEATTLPAGANRAITSPKVTMQVMSG